MDQVDDEQTVHWSIRSVTAGREVVRADRLYLPLNPQARGKPPCCGPVKVPVVGAAVRGPEARNAERARSTPPFLDHDISMWSGVRVGGPTAPMSDWQLSP